ncbi:kinase-like protein [Fomitiporia mediterranea MF3/22]|uniref:kinase-like protein n=1 Tax=Fomitiporia mediterranea (strain MF3/22) TaxID=694068 RepID=UPI00044093A2|nr:kinase-like protein [Fomitiporia mediterranea MF3/22]EJD06439.1 kinase-like protein [Fomitiporia mediterranea MF3/22]
MWKRSASPRHQKKGTTSGQNEQREPTMHSEGADNTTHVKFAPEPTKINQKDKRSQPSHYHNRRRHIERPAHSQRKVKSDKYAGSKHSGSTASKPSRLRQLAMLMMGSRKRPKRHSRMQSKGTATSRTTKTSRTTEESGTTKTSGTGEESEAAKPSRTTKASGETRTSRSGTTSAGAKVGQKPKVIGVVRPNVHKTVKTRTEPTRTGGTGKVHTTKGGFARERETAEGTERNRHGKKQSDQNAEVTDLVKLGGGTVWRGNHSKLGVVAFKRVIASDPREKKEAEKELRRSREVSGHPNIIQFHEGFNRTMESVPYVVSIFQYAAGGDLKGRIERKTLNEDNKKVVIRGSLKGLKHLHNMNLVHGNLTRQVELAPLRPTNILFLNPVDKDVVENDIKLTNFRLTERIPKDKSVVKVNSLCIEEHYMPPEGLDCDLSYALDVWTLGVTCYEMYNGLESFPIIKPHPNDKRSKDEVAQAILRLKEVWNQPGWSNYEQGLCTAKSLCQQMLDTKFASRISVEKALNHPPSLKRAKTCRSIQGAASKIT